MQIYLYRLTVIALVLFALSNVFFITSSQIEISREDLSDVAKVQSWLKSGGNPNSDMGNTNVFLLAIDGKAPLAVIRLFINNNLDVSSPRKFSFYLDDGSTVKQCTPLAIAIIGNQIEIAKLLLESGVDILETQKNLREQCIAEDYSDPEFTLKSFDKLLSEVEK